MDYEGRICRSPMEKDAIYACDFPYGGGGTDG